MAPLHYKQAIQALAAQGLAGMQDASAVAMLAWCPDDMWGPGFLSAAWTICSKYEQELRRLGIDLTALPKPPVARERRAIGVRPQGGFYITYPYKDKQVLDAGLRQIPGLHAVMQPVFHWEVNPVLGSGKAILDYGKRYGFYMAPSVETEARRIDALIDKDSPLPSRHIELAGDTALIYFEYSPALITTIKGMFHRPKYQPLPVPHWMVRLNPLHAKSLLDLATGERFMLATSDRDELARLAEVPSDSMRMHDIHLVVTIPPFHKLNGYLKGVHTSSMQKLPTGLIEWRFFAAPQIIDRVCQLARQYEVEVPADLLDGHQQWLADWHANVAASRKQDGDVSLPGLGGELLPFQRGGVEQALRLFARQGGVMLGDEQGLGKTPQSAAVAFALDRWPIIICCPGSLALKTRTEFRKWVPGRSIKILAKYDAQPGDYDAEIIICPYSILGERMQRGMGAELQRRGVRVMICDESQKLKGFQQEKLDDGSRVYKVKRVRGAYDLAQLMDYKLLLSGTSAMNNPIDLASQLDILGFLEPVFGGMVKFAIDFCGAGQTAHGFSMRGKPTVEAAKALNDILRGLCYVRRMKNDVLKDLPQKRRVMVPMDITNRKEYDRAERDFLGWLEEELKEDWAFREAIKEFSPDVQRKLINDRAKSEVERAAKAERLVQIGKLKRLAAKGKPYIEWLEDWLDTGEKILVFADNRDILESIITHFPDCARLVAEDKDEERQANVDRFNTDPNCLLMVASIAVGGEGHTLHANGACSNIAMIQFAWNPAIMDQAEDRIHRIGQTAESCTIWQLVAMHTIEESIVHLIETKRAVVSAALNGTSTEQDDTGIMSQLIAELRKRGKKLYDSDEDFDD